jgi:hypothetical protein
LHPDHLHNHDHATGMHNGVTDGGAVRTGRRAIGSVVVVDPVRAPTSSPCATALACDTAILELTGPGALVAAAADSAHQLRRRPDAGMAAVHQPSRPGAAATP